MPTGNKRPAIPKNVRTLSWISFFTDMSSEMLYPILPFFLTVTLGAPASVLGAMEGTAEALSALGKGLSGPLSDRIRRRKSFVSSGYALSSLAKLSLALSPSWGLALASRLVERTGKGLRTPARDALIAEASETRSRGRAFGYHRAMDTWGAVIGAVIAYLLLLKMSGDFRTVFFISLLPAFLAVALTAKIKEPRRRGLSDPKLPVRLLFRPPRQPGYRRFLVTFTLFSLGTSSATFLLLRARSAGFSYPASILPYILSNLIYAATSERTGRLSDSVGRKTVLAIGMGLFTAAYGALFIFTSTAVLFLAFGLYGIYLATTEGIGKALVTEMVEKDEYGQALGFFYLVTGAAALTSSLIAGILWDQVSPRAPFLQGAIFGLAGLVAMLALSRPRPR